MEHCRGKHAALWSPPGRKLKPHNSDPQPEDDLAREMMSPLPISSRGFKRSRLLPLPSCSSNRNAGRSQHGITLRSLTCARSGKTTQFVEQTVLKERKQLFDKVKKNKQKKLRPARKTFLLTQHFKLPSVLFIHICMYPYF